MSIRAKMLTPEEALAKPRGMAFGYKILAKGKVAIYRRDHTGVVTGTYHKLADVRDFLRIRFMFDPMARVPGTTVELTPQGRLKVRDGPSAVKIGRKPLGDEPMTSTQRMRRLRARLRAEADAKAKPLN